MAYQFLIVVAGGTGSAGSGNPFNDLRSLLIFVNGKTNFGLDLFLSYAWFMINWGLNRMTAKGYLSLAVSCLTTPTQDEGY